MNKRIVVTKAPTAIVKTAVINYPPPPSGGEWSQYQLEVFKDVAYGVGHTIIEATAGSAKTSTIVAALQVVRPKEEVFFSAFNKRIVEELKDRVPWTVNVNTLHSYGFRAVKDAYGSTRPNPKRVREMLMTMYGSDKTVTFDVREQIEKTVSLAKNSFIGALLDSDENRVAIDNLMDGFSITVGIKRDRFIEIVIEVLERCRTEINTGEIDFDDMIWLPVVNDLRLEKYDRVFVDELQDLNPTQSALIKGSVKSSGRFTGVGDRNQAIYLFRNADSDSIPNITAYFNAKTLPLSICYRCPVGVVRLAQELVPEIEPAPNAPEGIVAEVSQNVMYETAEPGDFILSRMNAQLLQHALRFIIDNRRAVILGRDIGNMLSAFVRRSKQSTIEGLLKHTADWLLVERERLLGVDPPKKREFQLAQDKAMCIRVLASNSETVQDLIEFIERIFADSSDKNSIILSTVHKCKGLESNRVFILLGTFRSRREYWEPFARSEGWLQARVEENNTQEERNVFYVAITRAREELLLVKPDTSNVLFEEE